MAHIKSWPFNHSYWSLGKLSVRFRTVGLQAPVPTTVERAVTPADIANMDQLDIDDFSCDFSSVEIPTGAISDQQMNLIVDQFFDGLDAAAS